MSAVAYSPVDQKRVAMAKIINDLDDLVRLILTSLTRTKPWQRHLASRLGDVDRLVQVLRLTIAMEKSDAQIAAAAEDVARACRRAAASLAGTRADFPSQQAVALASDLGEKLRSAFTEQT